MAAIDDANLYCFSTLIVCVPYWRLNADDWPPLSRKVTPQRLIYSKEIALEYLLSIVNSKLMLWYFNMLLTDNLSVTPSQISNLPIRPVSPSNSEERRIHDELTALVIRIQELNQQVNSLGEFDIDRCNLLRKEIKATDEKIDNLVYDLYGLTEEERKIVESQNGS